MSFRITKSRVLVQLRAAVPIPTSLKGNILVVSACLLLMLLVHTARVCVCVSCQEAKPDQTERKLGVLIVCLSTQSSPGRASLCTDSAVLELCSSKHLTRGDTQYPKTPSAPWPALSAVDPMYVRVLTIAGARKYRLDRADLDSIGRPSRVLLSALLCYQHSSSYFEAVSPKH